MSDLSISNIQLILRNLCSKSASVSREKLNEVFIAVSNMCRDSVATQSELSEGDSCNLIIAILNDILLTQSESNVVNAIISTLSHGVRAILALLAGNNSIVNQTVLAKCIHSKICNVVMECLDLSMKQLARYNILILPNIHTVDVEVTVPDRLLVQDLAEHSLMLVENLLLHPIMYMQLVGKSLMCSIRLVDCLKEVAKVRSLLIERCLSALGNLLSLANCNLGTCTDTPDGAEILSSQVVIQQCVDAGICDGVIAALALSGCEDVSTADCALFLVQSLAAVSPEAVVIFQSIRSVHSNSSSFPQQRLAVKPVPSSSDLVEDGAIALLVCVLDAHCSLSSTVVESALGAIGALVLQSPSMTLHLLGNRGAQTVVAALRIWGMENSAICSKAMRILTAVIQMTRRCKAELQRVNSYFEMTSSKQGLHSSTTISRTGASLSCELNVFDAEEDEEGGVLDGQMEGSIINIGVEGATAALVFRVLERVDLACLLMEAENGTLEREIEKHGNPVTQSRVAGMAAVGSLALAALKVKSFKESVSGGSSKKSAVSIEFAAEAIGKHSKSTSALPRLMVASRALTTGTPLNSSSISNLKAALERAKLNSPPALASPVASCSPSTESGQILLESEKEPYAVSGTPVYVLVLRLLDCHGTRLLEVLFPALQLLLELCGHYAFPYQWIQLSNSGGCAVLVKALASNRSLISESSGGPNDIDTVYTYELGLQVLQNLAQCNLETREKLCQLSAHTIAVDALHYHGGKSVPLCRLASEVFVQLYDSVSALEANEGNPRACTSLLHLVQQHQLQQYLSFTVAGMSMFKQLALFSPNRRILAEHGGCAVIADLIRRHTLSAAGPRHPRIAYLGLATISHMAGLEENQSRIAKCGGCRLVVELVREYGLEHEPIAAEGLSALSALAMSNKGMLGEVGACDAIVSILRRYSTLPETPHDLMARVACVAIFNLAFQYSSNKQRFLQLDIIPELKKLLNYRVISYSTREAVKDAVNIVNF